MARLPTLLTTDDLPLAELSALRCDGVVTAIDGCFAPIDEVSSPALRARAVHGLVRDRLIAERMTAAWIWGAVVEPPVPHQLCTGIDARVAHIAVPWLDVRQVVLTRSDTIDVGGMLVTTPTRTIADIARFAASWGVRERATVENLHDLGHVDRGSVLKELERVNLPHKRRALARLGLIPS